MKWVREKPALYASLTENLKDKKSSGCQEPDTNVQLEDG